LCSAIITNGTVTLATAYGEHSALAITTWALECALIAKEARVAGAVLGLRWATTASHKQTKLQEEGRVSSKFGLASRVLLFECGIAIALVTLSAREHTVSRVAHELAGLTQELERHCICVSKTRLDAERRRQGEACRPVGLLEPD